MEHSYSVLSGSICPNGKTAEGWKDFDQIICRFLIEQKVPGASVAISKNGVILYQQGYGVAGAGRRVHQDSMFRIASISKPVTAAIIIQLCDKLKLSLNTKVFGKAGILKSYRTRDKRMKKITIRHLLQHSAGWDRDKVGDAVFVRPQCVVKEHPDSQAFNSALLAYALRRKLQFAPGTWHSYSNLGYLALGEVIEALSGQTFRHVMKAFLQELNIHSLTVGKRVRAHWTSREVEYFNNREPHLVASIYPEEGEVVPHYGGMAIERSASYGGLVSDTVSLLQFVHCMEESFIQSTADEDTAHSNNIQSESIGNQTDRLHQRPDVVERHTLLCDSPCNIMVTADGENCDHCENNIVNTLSTTSDCIIAGMTSRSFKVSHVIKVNDIHQSVNAEQSAINFASADNHMQGPFSTQPLSEHCDACKISHLKSNLMGSTSDLHTKYTITDHVNCKMCGKSSPLLASYVDLSDNSDRYKDIYISCDQFNSSDVLYQPGLTSETCDIDVPVACSLQAPNTEYLVSEQIHNGEMMDLGTGHVYDISSRNQESVHVSDSTHSRLSKPLLTTTQARESLSQPYYENGCDWYGLGWDVQDNGRSWGHTGGMEGSCGTIFHHISGFNWVFLLNSWTADSDLNGVLKCALCSVPYVNMYNQDVLNFDSELGVRIVTCDKSQIICLYLNEFAILKIISEMKADGYFMTWISCISQDISCITTGLLQGGRRNDPLQQRFTCIQKSQQKYVAIFRQSYVKEYFTIFNKTVRELKSIVHEYKKENFVIDFLDSYVDSRSQLKFTAVFKYGDSVSCDTVVLLAVKAADYVKCVKSYVKSHHLMVQTVTEVCDELYVSAILTPTTACSINPLQIDILEHTHVHTCQDAAIKGEDVMPNLIPAHTDICPDAILRGSPELKVKQCLTNKNSGNTPETSFLETVEDAKREHNLAKIFHKSLQDGSHEMNLVKTLPESSDDGGHCLNLLVTKTLLEPLKVGNQKLNLRNILHPSVEDTRNHHSSSRTIKERCMKSKRTKKSNLRPSLLNFVFWVQLSPESFLTELNRQIQRKSGLVYAKFYTSNKKPYASGCWLPHKGGNSYQRTAMSKYGLVPELVEGASKNIHLQSLSEYREEDGTFYYAAIWHG